MKEQPSYYAIIPANVRYDKSLKANEKLLYGEITALSGSTGKCYATNEYFANLYDVSTTSISKWVSNLIKHGHVKSQVTYNKKSVKSTVRYLTIVQGGNEEKLKTPLEEKFNLNNTSKNTTSKNITIELLPTFNEYWDLYDKKIDKPKCENKWNKLTQKDKESIISYLPFYIKNTPNKKFRKNPTTFLNNRSWENEIINNNGNGKNRPKQEITIIAEAARGLTDKF